MKFELKKENNGKWMNEFIVNYSKARDEPVKVLINFMKFLNLEEDYDVNIVDELYEDGSIGEDSFFKVNGEYLKHYFGCSTEDYLRKKALEAPLQDTMQKIWSKVKNKDSVIDFVIEEGKKYPSFIYDSISKDEITSFLTKNWSDDSNIEEKSFIIQKIVHDSKENNLASELLKMDKFKHALKNFMILNFDAFKEKANDSVNKELTVLFIDSLDKYELMPEREHEPNSKEYRGEGSKWAVKYRKVVWNEREKGEKLEDSDIKNLFKVESRKSFTIKIVEHLLGSKEIKNVKAMDHIFKFIKNNSDYFDYDTLFSCESELSNGVNENNELLKVALTEVMNENKNLPISNKFTNARNKEILKTYGFNGSVDGNLPDFYVKDSQQREHWPEADWETILHKQKNNEDQEKTVEFISKYLFDRVMAQDYFSSESKLKKMLSWVSNLDLSDQLIEKLKIRECIDNYVIIQKDQNEEHMKWFGSDILKELNIFLEEKSMNREIQKEEEFYYAHWIKKPIISLVNDWATLEGWCPKFSKGVVFNKDKLIECKEEFSEVVLENDWEILENTRENVEKYKGILEFDNGKAKFKKDSENNIVDKQWVEWESFLNEEESIFINRNMRVSSSVEGFNISSEVLGIQKHIQKLEFDYKHYVKTLGDDAYTQVELEGGLRLPKHSKVIEQNQFKFKEIPEGFKIPKGVVTIENGAFRGASLPKGFTIPSSVKSIKEWAFSEAKFKEGFTFPNNIKEVDKGVFNGAELPKGFTLGTELVSIRREAFKDAKLPEGFAIPLTVKEIGVEAFMNTKIPVGFTKSWGIEFIDHDAFRGARLPKDFKITKVTKAKFEKDAFRSVFIDGDIEVDEQWKTNEYFKDAMIRDSNKWKTFNDGTNTIGEGAYQYITLPEDFSIPHSITSIGNSAFKLATLPKGFTIPSSVVSIGDEAFRNNITIPEGFGIPEGIKTINNSAFRGAVLPEGFTIPSSVTSIGKLAFRYAILPDAFTIPDTVKRIDKSSFEEAQHESGESIVVYSDLFESSK